MRRIRILLITLALMFVCVSVSSAQAVKEPRFVVLDDYVRDFLSQEWDAHLHDAVKLERGYCLRWQFDIWAGEPAYRVTQISTPDSVEATQNSIMFTCPTGPHMAEIHIHPATTCTKDVCWDGGPYAWQCLGSDQDRKYLVMARQPFGMVQCSREATVFYFPFGDNR